MLLSQSIPSDDVPDTESWGQSLPEIWSDSAVEFAGIVEAVLSGDVS
jgi:hypothetical protein